MFYQREANMITRQVTEVITNDNDNRIVGYIDNNSDAFIPVTQVAEIAPCEEDSTELVVEVAEKINTLLSPHNLKVDILETQNGYPVLFILSRVDRFSW